MAKRSRKPAGRKPEPGKPSKPLATGGSEPTGWSGLRPWARYAFVLTAVVVWLAGVALRGGIVHPETVYDSDPAFHDRMVRHLLDTGHYLESDPLFVQSPPRSPARDMYPTFYHYAAAGFAWLTERLAGLPVADALMLFGALVGSLLIPLTGWVMWRFLGRPIETLLAMLLTTASSAAILRGSYAILRPEALGAALAVLATILFWIWQDGNRPWPRRLLLISLGIAHFAGAGTWRPFPLLAALGGISVLASSFVDGRRPRLWAPIVTATTGLATAGFTFTFYRNGGVNHLLYLFPVPLLLLLQWVLSDRRMMSWCGKLGSGMRWAILAGITLVGVLIAHAAVPFLRVRVEAWLTPGTISITTTNLYGRIVSELRPIDWTVIHHVNRFSYLPLVLVILFILWVLWPAVRLRHSFLPLSAASFGMVAALAVRFEYIAIPFVFALLVAGLTITLSQLIQAQRNRSFVVIGVALVCLPFVLSQAIVNMDNLRSPSRREIARRACFNWMRQNLPQQTVIASGWDKGFELQSYTGCATLTDGYLENAINRERGLSFYKALFSTDENLLASYCRGHHCRHVLLDRYDFLPIAQTLQFPLEQWVKVSELPDKTLRVDILPTGRELVYIQLLSGYPTRYFQPINAEGNFLVLEYRN